MSSSWPLNVPTRSVVDAAAGRVLRRVTSPAPRAARRERVISARLGANVARGDEVAHQRDEVGAVVDGIG